MAKIFSNIAKNAPDLAKRYDDSTVTNELTTFNALRTVGGANRLFVANTPRNVYNLYTDPTNISSPLVKTFTTSQLVEPEQVVRVRRSKFYEAFPIVNANFTALNVPVNDTLVEIKPYSQANNDEIYSVETSRMLRDDRTNPLVSGPRDVVRMNRYLSSREGLNFKLNQQILQAGNTFGQSQGYNPVSVETMVLNYRNATLFNPLERVSRILTSNAITNPDLQGRLQKETVLNSQSKLRLKFVGGAARPLQSPVLGAINNLLSSTLRDRVNSLNIPIPAFARNLANFSNRTLGTNFSAGNSINVGQVGRQLDNIAAGAEAIRRGLNTNNSTLEADQTAYDALYLNNLWPLVKENDGTVRNFQGPQGTREQYLQRARQAIRKGSDINNVNKNTVEYPTDDYRSSATYTEDVRSTGTKTKEGLITATYIKDQMNLVNGVAGTSDAKQLDGQFENSDYVKFRIVVPGVFDRGINFRAFIEDINHSSRGQYDEVRYVGRPERFITYKGMNRNVTFGMYLVAFSEQELDTIWARANMLNKLTFPIDAAGGFMVPPIAKLTIGNIFINQAGYVENVDMRLQDIPWDIDRELPQAIKLNMTYNIIEEGFITQAATNPFAPASQLFGERDVTQRTNQLFANAERTNQSINSLLGNLNIPSPNIPNITTDLSFPRGTTTQTGASIAGYLDQRDLDAQRRAEVRFNEGAERIARQQELDRRAAINNELQGSAEGGLEQIFRDLGAIP